MAQARPGFLLKILYAMMGSLRESGTALLKAHARITHRAPSAIKRSVTPAGTSQDLV
jgi:hypothetical protein